MTLQSIHQLLRVASHLLDQAAAEIHASDLEPVQDNVECIGRALIEVIEVQRRIYEEEPDLAPRALAASPKETDASRLFTAFTMEALALEEAGKTAAARDKYSAFIGISSSRLHREIARAEIRRLS